MRVISKKRLVDFWTQAGHEESEQPLRAWLAITKNRSLSWTCFGDVKNTFGQTDKVGDCVVFDIGGNKYRIIAKIKYEWSCVYVRRVLTHQEYDQGGWKSECDKKSATKQVARRSKKRSTGGSLSPRRQRKRA